MKFNLSNYLKNFDGDDIVEVYYPWDNDIDGENIQDFCEKYDLTYEPIAAKYLYLVKGKKDDIVEARGDGYFDGYSIGSYYEKEVDDALSNWDKL